MTLVHRQTCAQSLRCAAVGLKHAKQSGIPQRFVVWRWRGSVVWRRRGSVVWRRRGVCDWRRLGVCDWRWLGFCDWRRLGFCDWLGVCDWRWLGSVTGGGWASVTGGGWASVTGGGWASVTGGGWVVPGGGLPGGNVSAILVCVPPPQAARNNGRITVSITENLAITKYSPRIVISWAAQLGLRDASSAACFSIDCRIKLNSSVSDGHISTSFMRREPLNVGSLFSPPSLGEDESILF